MSSPVGTTGACKVLLVDDRPSNLVSMRAVLEGGRYEILLANSGAEALELVLWHDFACIILDVAMPGMDGFEIARLIKERERSRAVPIIFVTASALDMENVFQAYTVGAVDYLQKPVSAPALRAKVRVFVELREQARQIERQAQELREAQQRERALLERRASEEARRRRRAVEALDISEARFRVLEESGLIGVLYFDLSGAITGGNEAFWRLLGYRHPADVTLLEIVPEKARADEERQLLELRSSGLVAVMEKELVRVNGTPVFVLMGRAVLSRLDRGVAVGFVLDVTRQKLTELERARILGDLRAAVLARDEFLSMAAHELRTPLTPLRLQLDALSRSMARGESPPRHRIERMDRAARRLEKLINQLLDVSRLTAGRLRLEVESFDMVALVREVVERWRTAREEADIRLEVPPAPIQGSWDRLRVDQVVENLVSNALKYGRASPVEVEVAADDVEVTIRVRDHGVGIPGEALARIFERFERAGEQQQHEGFGIGLWIARQSVEAHGGKIDVTSKLGLGSTFTVVLPRAPPGNAIPRASAGRVTSEEAATTTREDAVTDR